MRTLFDWASSAEKDGSSTKELTTLLTKAEMAYLARNRELEQSTEDLFFLRMACQTSILCFFQVKLAEGQVSTAVGGSARPILDYALYENKHAHPRIIEALLKAGADSDQPYGLGTVWGRFMGYVDQNIGELGGENIRDVIRVLVELGADLGAVSCGSKSGRVT